MVPIDLRHVEALEKAMAVAADLSRHYDARITLVGVTASGPTFVAGTPQDYQRVLARYGAEQSEKLGVSLETRAIMDPDPSVDLHGELLAQTAALDADLVVMASHVPGFREYLLSSNAGHLASHASVSVFIVR